MLALNRQKVSVGRKLAPLLPSLWCFWVSSETQLTPKSSNLSVCSTHLDRSAFNHTHTPTYIEMSLKMASLNGQVPGAGPYVNPGQPVVNLAPMGSNMATLVPMETPLGAGAIAAIVVASVLAAVVLSVGIFMALDGPPPRRPAVVHLGAEEGPKQEKEQHAVRLTEEKHQKTGMPEQYQNGQPGARRVALQQTMRELEEEHKLVGTCMDPSTSLSWESRGKGQTPDGEWVIRMLEGQNHPHNKKLAELHKTGQLPQAPPMPMPEDMYNEADVMDRHASKCS
jgi:hypothetical protein